MAFISDPASIMTGLSYPNAVRDDYMTGLIYGAEDSAQPYETLPKLTEFFDLLLIRNETPVSSPIRWHWGLVLQRHNAVVGDKTSFMLHVNNPIGPYVYEMIPSHGQHSFSCRGYHTMARNLQVSYEEIAKLSDELAKLPIQRSYPRSILTNCRKWTEQAISHLVELLPHLPWTFNTSAWTWSAFEAVLDEDRLRYREKILHGHARAYLRRQLTLLRARRDDCEDEKKRLIINYEAAELRIIAMRDQYLCSAGQAILHIDKLKKELQEELQRVQADYLDQATADNATYVRTLRFAARMPPELPPQAVEAAFDRL